jgi:hypothetical protein
VQAVWGRRYGRNRIAFLTAPGYAHH